MVNIAFDLIASTVLDILNECIDASYFFEKEKGIVVDYLLTEYAISFVCVNKISSRSILEHLDLR